MPARRLMRTLARTTTRIAGYGLIGIGGVLALSPIPTGAVLMGLGAAVLIPRDQYFRTWLRDSRRRWSWFDSCLHTVGKCTPGRYGRFLRR